MPKAASGCKDFSLDQDFVRNAAALLRPGNSAILATLQKWKPALTVLSGYSPLVLHTRILRGEDSNGIIQ